MMEGANAYCSQNIQQFWFKIHVKIKILWFLLTLEMLYKWHSVFKYKVEKMSSVVNEVDTVPSISVRKIFFRNW